MRFEYYDTPEFYMANLLGLSHTFFIILITVLVSIWAWKDDRLMNRLILWSPAVKQGQYDRFISSGFIHADGMHLLFNMITLFFFGQAIEKFYTQFLAGMGFILFYLGGLVVASLPSYLKHKNNPHWASLGASGAISAILFAYILFEPWSLIFVFFIPMPAILFAILYVGYSIWAGRKGNSNINHSAHLWGAAYGLILTIAIEPKIIFYFIHKLMTLPW